MGCDSHDIREKGTSESRSGIWCKLMMKRAGTSFYLTNRITLHPYRFVWRQAAQRSPLFQTLPSRGPRVQFIVLLLTLRCLPTVFRSGPVSAVRPLADTRHVWTTRCPLLVQDVQAKRTGREQPTTMVRWRRASVFRAAKGVILMNWIRKSCNLGSNVVLGNHFSHCLTTDKPRKPVLFLLYCCNMCTVYLLTVFVAYITATCFDVHTSSSGSFWSTVKLKIDKT